MINRFFNGMFTDSKIVRFLSVGVLNTVFGYAVYAALLFINTPYLVALFMSTVAGVVFNYFSFGHMVFQGRDGWFAFGKFVIAYTLIYGVNAVLLRALTNNFYTDPYLGQVICLPISVILSWLFMNYWVYKKR